MERDVRIPKGFVLPGDSLHAARTDLARAVARRLERRYVAFWQAAEKHSVGQGSTAQAYLNRLSDYFYLLARTLEQRAVKR